MCILNEKKVKTQKQLTCNFLFEETEFGKKKNAKLPFKTFQFIYSLGTYYSIK